MEWIRIPGSREWRGARAIRQGVSDASNTYREGLAARPLVARALDRISSAESRDELFPRLRTAAAFESEVAHPHFRLDFFEREARSAARILARTTGMSESMCRTRFEEERQRLAAELGIGSTNLFLSLVLGDVVRLSEVAFLGIVAHGAQASSPGRPNGGGSPRAAGHSIDPLEPLRDKKTREVTPWAQEYGLAIQGKLGVLGAGTGSLQMLPALVVDADGSRSRCVLYFDDRRFGVGTSSRPQGLSSPIPLAELLEGAAGRVRDTGGDVDGLALRTDSGALFVILDPARTGRAKGFARELLSAASLARKQAGSPPFIRRRLIRSFGAERVWPWDS